MAAPSRPDRSKPKRTPIGTRNKLTAEARPGFKRRFVNDSPGRIQQFLDAGYTIVNDGTEIGDKNVGTATRVGSNSQKPVGGGTTAVLMEIKDDWYREDQATKQRNIAKKEKSLLNDQEGNSIENNKNVYGDGVKLNSSRPTISVD